EEYQDYIFIVVKMLYFPKNVTEKNNDSLITEHLSFVVGEDYVLSFQEAGGDVFEGVRERVATAKGRIRSSGSDYLLLSLLDAIIDQYFEVVDVMGDRIELLEEDLFQARSGDDITFDIQEL